MSVILTSTGGGGAAVRRGDGVSGAGTDSVNMRVLLSARVSVRTVLVCGWCWCNNGASMWMVLV